MELFYVFSFVAIGLFSLALWSGISNNGKFGKRPVFLLISIFLFFSIGVIVYVKFYLFTDPIFTFPTFCILSVLYLLSFYFLEYSVHCQRILKSFLMNDFRVKLKSFYWILSLLSVISVASVVLYIYREQLLIPIGEGQFTEVVPFHVINYLLFVVFAIFFMVINLNINNNIFNLQQGVIRRQKILFTALNVMLGISAVFFILLNGFGYVADFQAFHVIPLQNFPIELMGVLNVIYAVRIFSEYYFQRVLNQEKTIEKQAESVELKNDLVNLVLNSPASEDLHIIRTTVRDSMDRSMRNLIVTEYRITGTFILRCTDDILKVDSPELIQDYCTPLINLPNINLKKQSNFRLNDMILKKTYDVKKLMETPAEQLTDWGDKLIKQAIETNEPVTVDPIPKEFLGLQRYIGLYPIVNVDQFYGIVVIFKDSFEFLFPEEKTAVNDLIDDLKIIFAIIEGKKVQKERNRLQDEMGTARRIQTSILPKEIKMDGYDAFAYMETASEVGGDAYDIFNSKYGNYLGIGDVSGHGLPAGITALIQQAAFQSAVFASETLEKAVRPYEIYNIVNKVLHRLNTQRIGSDKFMTQNYIYEKAGQFIHAGAHEIAILYHESEEKIVELNNFAKKTAFMGLSPLIDAKTSEGSFKMHQGDILVLYTDGFIEAKDHYSHQFGLERLERLILKHRHLPAEDLIQLIVKIVKEHAASGDMKNHNGKLADDISILIIKKL